MPPPSFLEQALVMKGDALNLISGVCKNGFPFGVRVMDFVLGKLLDNDKFTQVIGVSLGDRVDSAFVPYEVMYSHRFCLLSSTATIFPQTLSSPLSNDMIWELLQQTPTARLESVLHLLQKRLLNLESTSSSTPLLSATTAVPSKEASENCTKIAVMLYSFSELVLHVGEQRALSWLRSYLHATTSFVNIKVSTCVLIHSSLHPASFLAQIESVCNSVCRVQLTYGQFHTNDRRDICCTTHTVRKAPSTGRVGEGTDLFTIRHRKAKSLGKSTVSREICCDFYELEAVVSMKAIEHDAASVIKQDEVEEHGQGHESQTASSSLNSLLENQQSDINHNTNANITSTVMEPKNDGRGTVKEEVLVVFDRSDPEFESDSDPDDDLDL